MLFVFLVSNSELVNQGINCTFVMQTHLLLVILTFFFNSSAAAFIFITECLMNKTVFISFKAENSISFLVNSASAPLIYFNLRYTNAMVTYSERKSELFRISHATQQKITCHCVCSSLFMPQIYYKCSESFKKYLR